MPQRPELRFNFGPSSSEAAASSSSSRSSSSSSREVTRLTSSVQPILPSPLRPTAVDNNKSSVNVQSSDADLSVPPPVHEALPGTGFQESKQHEPDDIEQMARAAAAAAAAEALRAPSRAIFTERPSIDSQGSGENRPTPTPRQSAVLRSFRSMMGHSNEPPSTTNRWDDVKSRTDDIRALRVDDTDNVLSKLVFGAAFKSQLITGSPATTPNGEPEGVEVEIDSDISMSELANALRSAVARHLDADDWLTKLHDLFNAFDSTGDSRISRSEFSEAMRSMFSINFGAAILEKLFNYISLDNARSGYITWDNFLGFFTPKTSADVITIECSNTVTTVCFSRDVSVMAFGGLHPIGAAVLKFGGEPKEGEARAGGKGVSPTKAAMSGERMDQCIFKRKYSQGVTQIALSASGDRMYVGTFQKGKGQENSNIEVFNLALIPEDAPSVTLRGVERSMPYDQVEFSLSYPADVDALVLSNDDRILCVGGKAKSVVMFDTASRAMLCEIPYPSAVLSIAFTRPSNVTVRLDTSLNEVYSGEISVSDGAIHVFRNTLNEECVYVNKSSAKVLPGDYPSLVGKELAQETTAVTGCACKVVFSGRVTRTYSDRSGTVLLEGDDEEVYHLNPDTMEWYPVAHLRTAVSSPKSSARSLALNTKVVVTISGVITSIGERNVLAIGGDYGTTLVASFNTEIVNATVLADEDVLISRASQPGTHKRAAVSNSATTAIVAAAPQFKQAGMHISRIMVWETDVEDHIYGLSFSYHGDMLAIGTNKKILIMERRKRKQEVTQTFAFDEQVFKVALSRNGRQIAFACGNDLTVRDVATGCDLFQIQSADRVQSVNISGDGRMVAFGGKDKHVRLCNTTSGCTIHAFPVEEKVHGVAITEDGRRLAVGSDDRSCRVFNAYTKELLREWKHKHIVWAVDVAKLNAGYIVAAGDYAGDVIVRHIESNTELFHHKFVASGGPPFVWTVKFSGDASRFSSGSWNGEVRVWSTSDWTECCAPFHRPDRVFALAISRTGQLVLVGDRTGGCALYDLGSSEVPTLQLPNIFEESRSMRSTKDLQPKCLFDIAFVNRVFCVALSPDGEYFALGGVAKEVWLYRTKTCRRIHCFKVEGPITNSICFSADGKALAAGGEDKRVSIWDTASFERILFLPRKKDVYSLAFSKDSLVIAVGTKAVMYGGRGRAEWTWRDRPDFEIVTDVMGNAEAMECLLANFPSIPSVRSPHTGETVMQHCVRNYNTHDLRALLSSEKTIGFVRDTSGSHALKDALLLEKRASAVLLLDAVADGRVPTMASCLSAVTECFPLLSRTFPELLLNLVSSIKLEYEPEMMQDSANYAHLPSHDRLVRGSHLRSEPRDLWLDIFTKAGHLDDSRDANTDPVVRTEVVAVRVPFENFAGNYENLDDSPLHLITHCARELRMLDVFQSELMSVILQFKWYRFAREVFLIQTAVFLVLLIMVIFFATAASKGMDCECSFGEFYTARCNSPKGEFCTRSQWQSEQTAYSLWPFVFVFVGAFLLVELQQLAIEGMGYFSSLWNYLDVAAFGLQFLAQILWVSVRNSSGTAVRGMLAISCLLMVWKTMYYARGFPLLGPLVRMIVEIMADMRPFLLILLIFLASFAIALLIINPEPGGAVYAWKEESCRHDDETGDNDCQLFPEFLQFVSSVALFGGGDVFFREGVDPTRLNQIFLMGLLIIVQIVLLNLIIAVMGNTYSRVQQGAIQEALYERAHIIIEVESTWLPVVEYFKAQASRVKYAILSFCTCCLGHETLAAVGFDEDDDDDDESNPMYPMWLHVLRPGTLESAHTTDVKREIDPGKVASADLGRVEDMVSALATQVEDLTTNMRAIKAVMVDGESTSGLVMSPR